VGVEVLNGVEEVPQRCTHLCAGARHCACRRYRCDYRVLFFHVSQRLRDLVVVAMEVGLVSELVAQGILPQVGSNHLAEGGLGEVRFQGVADQGGVVLGVHSNQRMESAETGKIVF